MAAETSAGKKPERLRKGGGGLGQRGRRGLPFLSTSPEVSKIVEGSAIRYCFVAPALAAKERNGRAQGLHRASSFERRLEKALFGGAGLGLCWAAKSSTPDIPSSICIFISPTVIRLAGAR
jgi:hypothetical protein